MAATSGTDRKWVGCPGGYTALMGRDRIARPRVPRLEQDLGLGHIPLPVEGERLERREGIQAEPALGIFNELIGSQGDEEARHHHRIAPVARDAVRSPHPRPGEDHVGMVAVNSEKGGNVVRVVLAVGIERDHRRQSAAPGLGEEDSKRVALPAILRQHDHLGARLLGDLRRPVRRAVVRNDHGPHMAKGSRDDLGDPVPGVVGSDDCGDRVASAHAPASTIRAATRIPA